MGQIKCPNCGTTFTVDESGYADLLRQVRDEEFARQLAEQGRRIEEAAAARAQAAAAQAQGERDAALAQKDRAIAELTAQAQADRAAHELALRDAQAGEAGRLRALEQERDELRVRVQAQAEGFDVQKALAVQEASRALEAQVADLTARLAAQEQQARLSQELAVRQAASAAQEGLEAARRERDDLKARLDRADLERERAEALHATELASRVALMQEQIDVRDREIDNIKHMRAELSVKMIGESLEQYCENEFNKLRATAFQTAVFHKDNDAVDGTKGDYVYRELDDDGNEVVSIMFEMKNEADESTHRKRNEDHFKKLDQDRAKKGCEYAVLVSLLERDSEFYNTGIVDVSYLSGYPKMYVIRPQFFIPMITLIRNAARQSLAVRRELAQVRQQNVDVTNFETQLDDFKAAFGKNVDLAARKFDDAVADIDATIKKLEKIRDELTSSKRNLGLANKKLDDLTVKRLVRKNPTMRAKFDEARAARAAAGTPEPAEPAEARVVLIEDDDE